MESIVPGSGALTAPAPLLSVGLLVLALSLSDEGTTADLINLGVLVVLISL